MLSNYSHLVGGVAGGTASTLACHPLDFLRIRYAANEGKHLRPQYNSYWHALRSIIRVEGIRGIYQGLTPNLVAAPLSWGLYFHFYHKIHDFYGRYFNTLDFKKKSFFSNFVIGCLTGTIVVALTNPLWVTKTRLCLQYEHSTEQYRGMIDCLRKIYQTEGIRGLYRGFVPGLFGTVNGSIQFACYNFLKDYRCAALGLPLDHELGVTDYFLFSSISKIFSVLSTYPYQVFRTRLQDHNVVYDGLKDCVVRTWQHEGIRGMYKGAIIAVIKQTPSGIITYLTYEYARRLAEKF